MFVYILTTRKNSALYVGVSNDLVRRVAEHKEGLDKSNFTSRYSCNRLVYYEVHETPMAAIAREKQLKAGSRQRKLDLVNGFNPGWEDLYDKVRLVGV
jgi:putative endonuclease